MSSRSVPLSVLDLAIVGKGQSVRDGLDATVAVAQRAEQRGYRRVWYAEHHNMSSIASSATSVLIAHVAAHTSTIRLGSGGIMLPNHAPLTIAEQFGTLSSIHPGRIDLGLGRAPGSDQVTMHAMRRDAMSSDSFPQDVVELQGYLWGASRIEGVQAVPRASTRVPLYILGSSLFGAQLAAMFGLPYAFASHFSPDALFEAVATYRREFKPADLTGTGELSEPHVIVGANVIASEHAADARQQFDTTRRTRVRGMISRGPAAPEYTDEQIDAFLTTANGRQIANMMKYSVAGTPNEVRVFLENFAAETGADE